MATLTVVLIAGSSCVQDLLAPKSSVYSLEPVGALAGSFNVGDTIHAPEITLLVDGKPATTKWSFSVVEGSDVVTVDGGVLVGLKPGDATVRIRPQNSFVSDSGLHVDFAAHLVVPKLVISGPDTIYSIGEAGQLSASARSRSDAAIPGAVVTWSVVGADTAATLTSPSTGAVQSVRNGDITLKATTDTAVVLRELKVRQRAKTIDAFPATTLHAVGQARVLTAQARDAKGVAIAAPVVSWVSRTPSVVSAVAGGTVTALTPGSAWIVATANGPAGGAAAESLLVNVQPASLKMLSAPVVDGTQSVGTGTDVEVQLVTAAGAAIPDSGIVVSFDAFSGDGRFAGSQTTTARTDAQGRAKARLTLGADLDDDSVRVSGPGLAGTALKFMARPAPPARVAFVVQPSVVAAFQPINPSVQIAVQDSFGIVLTKAAGDVVVSLTPGTGAAGAQLLGTTTRPAVAGVATFDDLRLDIESPTYTLTATLASLPPATSAVFPISGSALKSVAVTPGGASLSGPGATTTLTAQARDASGGGMTGVALTWTSLNPDVATVNPTTGVVTAVASGQVAVSAAAANGIAGYAVMTVSAPTLAAPTVYGVPASPSNKRVYAAWFSSQASGWSVGDVGFLAQWNGSAWTQFASVASDSLRGVWGSSATDVFAVGSGGRIIRWNGTAWSSMESPTTERLHDVWGSAPNDVWAVGAKGTILRYNGTAWLTVTSPVATDLHSVQGTRANLIWAVGANGTVLRYDGTQWTQTSAIPTSASLQKLWVASPTDVFAVGSGGAIIRFNGADWSSMTSNTSVALRGVWGSSSSDVYAVGGNGSVSRYNGSAWATAIQAGDSLTFAASGFGSNLVMALGAGQTPIGHRAATLTVAPATSLNIASLNAIILLTASAKTAANAAIANVPLTWSSSAAAVTVDAGGIARGEANGSSSVCATAAGGAQSCATVVVSQVAALMTITAGGGQARLVDSTVTPMSVRVADAGDSPIAGVAVTFSIPDGGGSLTAPNQVTNASGIATVGSWRLGPTATVNRMEARVSPALAVVAADTARWIRRMRTGLYTTCAIKATSAVQCWGDNSTAFRDYGALPSTLAASATPVNTPAPALAELGQGTGSHWCGIKPDQSAVCWGRTSTGQLGDGNISSQPLVDVSGGISWAQMSTGRLHSCGISTSGAAYCWGSNQQGEIGNAAVVLQTNGVAVPTLVDGGFTWINISAGWLHSCGITSDFTAYCWGDNTRGELGIGTSETQKLVPTQVAGGLRFTQLAASSTYTCGITTTKDAYCWGFNEAGQLGDGTTTNRITPTLVSGGLKFTTIAVSSGVQGSTGQLAESFTCALTEAGKPYCWGRNNLGQLGDGTRTSSSVPVPVLSNLTLSGLSLGENFACGMRGEAIWCWGWNEYGQVGSGARYNALFPVAVTGGHTFTTVAVTNAFACALDTGGAAWCWGSPNPTNNDIQTSPLAVAGGLTFQSISGYSSTGNHVCAVTTSNAAYCWGNGQLGNGSTFTSETPVAVAGGLLFQSVSVGAGHDCGLTTTGSVYCWGANNVGQLGDGTTTSSATPVQVGGGATFSAISLGNGFACGISASGTVGQMLCWGQGNQFQLGNGGTAASSVPTPVSGALTFTKVAAANGASGNAACGLATDDKVYCWGVNILRGDGTGPVAFSTPTVLSDGVTQPLFSTPASMVTFSNTCAVKSGGSAFCWGVNTSGQLGTNSLTDNFTMSQVSSGQLFKAIVAGSTTCAISTANAAYCWGLNNWGQVGNGLSPRIPGRVTGY